MVRFEGLDNSRRVSLNKEAQQIQIKISWEGWDGFKDSGHYQDAINTFRIATNNIKNQKNEVGTKDILVDIEKDVVRISLEECDFKNIQFERSALEKVLLGIGFRVLNLFDYEKNLDEGSIDGTF